MAATVGADEEGVDLLAAGVVGLGVQQGKEVLEAWFGDAGVVYHCRVGEVEAVPEGDEIRCLVSPCGLFFVAAGEEDYREEYREEFIHRLFYFSHGCFFGTDYADYTDVFLARITRITRIFF